MVDFLVWPISILRPTAIEPNVVAFSRSGGVTLGGIQRVTRTDLGFWSIGYKGVSLYNPRNRQTWNAIRNHAGGMAGMFAVPVPSFDSAPWPEGAVNGRILTSHSDGTPFSDGTLYSQSAIGVTLAVAAAIGDTEVSLRIGSGITDLTGVRFSREHALYETGFPTSIVDDVVTVPIAPAIRVAIPADADLEFGMPTCLVHLATDSEMDVRLSAGRFDQRDVSFIEATDYWNDIIDGGS